MSGVFVYTAVAGFLAGVAVRGAFGVSAVFSLVCVCVGVAGMFLRQKTPVFFAALAVFFVCVGLGIVRADLSFSKSGNFLDQRIGHVTFEGTVVGEPESAEKSQKVVIAVLQGEEKARVSIITSFFPEFRYGDTLRVSGILKKPESFVTDSGREFDYARFLAKDDVYHQMLFPDIELLSRGGGNVFYRGIFHMRRIFVGTLKVFLPEPNAGLLAGITIGEKGGMDEETEGVFRRVGLIHIVVLSGYNITVVADTVMRLLSFLPRTLMLSSGGVIIVLFVVMTGASATAVRAGSMALLALLARFLGARYDITRALFFVACAMIVYNPHTLYDPSFQLSFLATFGLITLSGVIEKKLKKMTNMLSLRETFSATLATQVCVVPLLVYLSGEVSVVSLLANIVVLPIIPLSMFLGSVLGVAGSFFSVLGVALSFPAVLVSGYILFVSDQLSRVPFASIEAPVLSAPAVWVLYGVLFLFFMFWKAHTTRLPSASL